MNGTPRISSVKDYIRIDPRASAPIASQIAQQLAWLIASGTIRQGDKLPPVRELARDLKINFHTVRAAYKQLDSDGLIATQRGRRAIVLPHELDRLAASTPDLPTFTIGILIPNYSPYYAPFLAGLEAGNQNEPWLPFICETHYYTRNVRRYMEQLVAKNVDGIVVTHFETPYREELREILTQSKNLPPIVYADCPGMPGPGIAFDRFDGARQATRHLLDHGHRRLGFISPPLEWSSMADIFSGIKSAFKENGLGLSDVIVEAVDGFSIEEGTRAAERLFAYADPPSAILTSGDILAIGAMRAAKKRKLLVGQDVAIVGFGELDIAEVMDPPLTTVCLPASLLGMRTMALMRHLMRSEAASVGQERLPVELVIRGSCGCQ